MDAAAIGKKLKQQYPQYASVDDATLGEKYLSKYGGAVSSVQSGKLKLTDIPQEQRVGVAVGLDDSKSAESIALKGAPATDVNMLKDILDSAQAATQRYDPSYTGFGDAFQGLFRTTFNAKGAEKEQDFRGDIADIRTAIRNYISGAAIPRAEAKEFENLIPKVSDSDTQIQSKLKRLQERSIRQTENVLQTAGYDVAGEEYLKTSPTRIPDELKNKQQQTGNPLSDTISNNPLLNMILGTGAKIGQDVGTGVRATQSQGNFDQLEMQAKAFEDEAYATKDMQKRKDLLQNANNIRQQISGEAGNISQSFTEEVQDPVALRAILGAMEVAGAAEIPGATSTVKNLFKGGAKQVAKEGAEQVVQESPSMVKQVVQPFKSAGIIRDQAAEQATKDGVRIEGNKLLQFLDDAGKKLSPTDKKAYDTYMDRAKDIYKGKKITPTDSLDLLESANTAFNASGKTGKSAKAQFNKKLGDFLRKEYSDNESMQTIAKMNKRFGKLYPAKNFAVGAAKTAATGISTALLYKLLFGNENGG
jgi:hypothetical protein